jgi:hypothetical protein
MHIKRFFRNYGFILFAVLLLLLSAIYLVRSFFGFDWSDEAYYSAVAYRFLTGDKLFSNSWDIQQLSTLITLPLIAVFRFFNNGSNDGILLFMRMVFVIMQFLTGLYLFKVVSKNHSFASAFAAAAVFISFTPFCINSLSYNTLSMLFLTLSILLLYDSNESIKFIKVKHFLGGLTFALAVLAYPFLIFVLPVFLIYYAILQKKLRKAKTSGMFYAFWGCGVLVICLCFALFVCLNSSFDNLLKNLPYLLSDPQHIAVGIKDLALNYVKTIYSTFGHYVLYIFAVTFIAFGCSFLRNSAIKEKFKLILCIICFVLFSMCMYKVFFGDYLLSMKINLLVAPLVFIGPAIFFLNDKKYDNSIYLYFLGLLFSCAVQYGSNNGFYGSSYALILSTAAVVIYCSTITVKFNNKQYTSLLSRVLTFYLCGALAVSIGFIRVTGVYRDLPLQNLTQKIDKGPAKGIYTTTDSAKKYNDIISAIYAYAPAKGTVFYTSLLPFGYLCTNSRAATPAIWTTQLSSPRLEQYYKLHPELKPDFVFVVSKSYGIHNEDNPFEGYLAEYIKSGNFKKITLSCGTLYIKMN